jgi:hypothetical protein
VLALKRGTSGVLQSVETEKGVILEDPSQWKHIMGYLEETSQKGTIFDQYIIVFIEKELNSLGKYPCFLFKRDIGFVRSPCFPTKRGNIFHSKFLPSC